MNFNSGAQPYKQHSAQLCARFLASPRNRRFFFAAWKLAKPSGRYCLANHRPMSRNAPKLAATVAFLFASASAYADDPTGALLQERHLTPRQQGAFLGSPI